MQNKTVIIPPYLRQNRINGDSVGTNAYEGSTIPRPFLSNKENWVESGNNKKNIRLNKKKIGQLGRATPYSSLDGETFTTCVQPNRQKLALCDYALKEEPIFFDGVQKMTHFVRAKLGEFYHEDETITEFIRANTIKLKSWLSEITFSLLWSGRGDSEIVYKRCKSTYTSNPFEIWIDKIVNFHPLDVYFVFDEFNCLSHGKKSPNKQYQSGIWVPAPLSFRETYDLNKDYDGHRVRLPESKVWHTAINSYGNNSTGLSQFESGIKFFLYKQLFLEMNSTALDRYGNPLIYAVVPPGNTDQVIKEPDGSVRYKSYHQVVTEILEDLGGKSSIVLTQVDKDHPVKLDSLTTGNNFSGAFDSAIKLREDNMMIAMGIPNLILKDNNNGLGTGGAAERQMEAFLLLIDSIYDTVMTDFMHVIKYLIEWNFPPEMHKGKFGVFNSKILRVSELNVLGNITDKLLDKGVLDTNDPDDNNWIRETFGIPTRRSFNHLEQDQ